jgi:hypothetical protein
VCVWASFLFEGEGGEGSSLSLPILYYGVIFNCCVRVGFFFI